MLPATALLSLALLGSAPPEGAAYEAPGADHVPNCWERAYEPTPAHVGVHGILIDTPVHGVPGAPRPGPSLPGEALDSGRPEVLLVLAVAAAAALPVVVYALDAPAPPVVRRLHDCPSVDFRLLLGSVGTPTVSGRPAALTGVRAHFAQGPLGLQASVEQTVEARLYGAADAHLLLRAPPRKHIEGGLGLGWRRVVFGGVRQSGLEATLPHRYVLARLGAIRPLAIEVVPGVLLGERGLDVRLEAALSIPWGPAAVQLGGRVFSFDSAVVGAAVFGLSLGI